ncbi:MAG: PilZ domain-containing protein [Desulfovibrio sp.]|nr:PilZ domain-containing protein [Desulfovibrio sp.]
MENLNVMISLPPKLALALSELAQSQNITFSTLARTVLEQYLQQEQERELEEHETASTGKREKRKYVRKAISVPTTIRFKSGTSVTEEPVEMKDISLGGALLSLPAQHPILKQLVSHPNKFDLVISLPDEKQPVEFTSKTSRVRKDQENVHLGISFDEYSYYDFIKLYNFLG